MTTYYRLRPAWHALNWDRSIRLLSPKFLATKIGEGLTRKYERDGVIINATPFDALYCTDEQWRTLYGNIVTDEFGYESVEIITQ